MFTCIDFFYIVLMINILNYVHIVMYVFYNYLSEGERRDYK